jgi:uncharacterized protein YegP (UPF0339 family)
MAAARHNRPVENSQPEIALNSWRNPAESADKTAFRIEEEKIMASCKDRDGDTWEIYYGSDGWRWRRAASNGRIVGSSTQGYSNYSDCVANAQRNGMTCTPA